MDSDEIREQGSRSSIGWLPVLGGCALSATIICSLVLAVLLIASTAFNVYLAWNLSGYEVSVSRSTSTSSAVVLVTPTGVLAIIPTPTSTPTSTTLPTATVEPTSTSTPVPTEAPTNVPTSAPTQTTPESESATPTAAASQGADTDPGGGGEGTDLSDRSPMRVAASTSQEPGQPTSETIPYVVQEGDTLWVIADRAYNSGTLWQVIFEENRDILDSADQIQPGQVLRIPLNP